MQKILIFGIFKNIYIITRSFVLISIIYHIVDLCRYVVSRYLNTLVFVRQPRPQTSTAGGQSKPQQLYRRPERPFENCSFSATSKARGYTYVAQACMLVSLWTDSITHLLGMQDTRFTSVTKYGIEKLLFGNSRIYELYRSSFLS